MEDNQVSIKLRFMSTNSRTIQELRNRKYSGFLFSKNGRALELNKLTNKRIEQDKNELIKIKSSNAVDTIESDGGLIYYIRNVNNFDHIDNIIYKALQKQPSDIETQRKAENLYRLLNQQRLDNITDIKFGNVYRTYKIVAGEMYDKNIILYCNNNDIIFINDKKYAILGGVANSEFHFWNILNDIETSCLESKLSYATALENFVKQTRREEIFYMPIKNLRDVKNNFLCELGNTLIKIHLNRDNKLAIYIQNLKNKSTANDTIFDTNILETVSNNSRAEWYKNKEKALEQFYKVKDEITAELIFGLQDCIKK